MTDIILSGKRTKRGKRKMFEIVRVHNHYNLYFNGEFIGSADNYAEIDELKREYKESDKDYVLFD